MELMDVPIDGVDYSIEVEADDMDFEQVRLERFEIFQVFIGDKPIPIEHLSEYILNELYGFCDSIAADQLESAMEVI